MDDSEDASLQFFPDGNVDLYAVLQVKPEATQEEIKKAYRKLALRLHPDKILTSTSTSTSTTAMPASDSNLTPTQLFQRLSFSYSILSDQKRRSRYDSTGMTSEPAFGAQDFDWNDYFETLWTGEVSGNRLNEFKLEYQNSSEERADITEAYLKHQGSLPAILSEIPCSEVLTDETRIISIVEDLIKSKDIKRLKGWSDSLKDEKAREKMRTKAKKEATEAEEMAKEMGVWEELFGDGRKSEKKTSKGKKLGKEEAEIGSDDGHEDADEEEEEEEEDQDEVEHDEEDEEARPRKKSKPSSSNVKKSTTTTTANSRSKTKSKSKASASTASNSKTSKTKTSSASKSKKSQSSSSSSSAKKAVEEDPSLSGLASIIASRQKQRAGDMDGLLERLEREAEQEQEGKGGAKGKGKRKTR